MPRFLDLSKGFRNVLRYLVQCQAVTQVQSSVHYVNVQSRETNSQEMRSTLSCMMKKAVTLYKILFSLIKQLCTSDKKIITRFAILKLGFLKYIFVIWVTCSLFILDRTTDSQPGNCVMTRLSSIRGPAVVM